MFFAISWAVLFALGVGLEIAALIVGHGTLSGFVWAMMKMFWPRVIIVAFFGWLAYHWFLEGPYAASLRKTYVDDIVIAGLLAFLSIFAGKRRSDGP